MAESIVRYGPYEGTQSQLTEMLYDSQFCLTINAPGAHMSLAAAVRGIRIDMMPCVGLRIEPAYSTCC